MNHRVSDRRRREIRKRQKERKRTNDARKAEAKLFASVESDTLPPGTTFWRRADAGVKMSGASRVIKWIDQSPARSKSK